MGSSSAMTEDLTREEVNALDYMQDVWHLLSYHENRTAAALVAKEYVDNTTGRNLSDLEVRIRHFLEDTYHTVIYPMLVNSSHDQKSNIGLICNQENLLHNPPDHSGILDDSWTISAVSTIRDDIFIRVTNWRYISST